MEAAISMQRGTFSVDSSALEAFERTSERVCAVFSAVSATCRSVSSNGTGASRCGPPRAGSTKWGPS
ncbi:hypothetical protein AB0O67_03375 [Streptomyces sp. NPDC086077]|uniref:hypothetical protein n=1 Tax=Streptomyces sp. NPDC086077 TaxID=3154862 RepID=UPI0034351C20